MTEQIGVDAVELISLCLDPLSELYCDGAEAKVIFDNARACVETILEDHVVVPRMQPDPSEDPDGITLVTAAEWAKLHDERKSAQIRLDDARDKLAVLLWGRDHEIRALTLEQCVSEVLRRCALIEAALTTVQRAGAADTVNAIRGYLAGRQPVVPT